MKPSGSLDDDDDDGSSLKWKSALSTGEAGSKSTRGLCGLYNLGNTCFMNSALQCLSNTPPLRDYLLSGEYAKELNRTNPLGTKGELTSEFARLVGALWSGRGGAVSPRDFKWTLGQFAHQFSGYQQQDSQELMGFLLDGMHEDLNRVIKKPLVEAVETDGKADLAAAEESWAAHKKRNDSIIVDTFMGQLRNTVVCPDCHAVSVTFDPMMFLSVPLPSESKVNIKFELCPLDFTKPRVKFCLEMKMTDTIATLKKRLVERQEGLSDDRLLVADVWRCKIHRQLKDTEQVTQIGTGDEIFVYETPVSVVDSDKDWVGIEFTAVKYPHSYCPECIPPLILRIGKRGVTTQREVMKTAHDIASALFQAKPDEEMAVQLATHDYDGDTADAKDVDEPIPGLRVRTFYSWETPRDQRFIRAFMCCDSTKKCEKTTVGEAVEDSSIAEKERRLKAKITLADCLALFTTEERLNQENMWYCRKCKEHKMATKKMELFALPKVLIVHLKRFRNQSSYYREKIERPIVIPDGVIDFTPYLASTAPQQSTKYRVFAVSNHFGGLGGGHYIAHAVNTDSGRWHQFDDSFVSPADGQAACEASSAYVLFMERLGGEPPFAAAAAAAVPLPPTSAAVSAAVVAVPPSAGETSRPSSSSWASSDATMSEDDDPM